MGQVEGIYIERAPREMPSEVPEVRAIAGQGLQGDPYVEQGLGGGTGMQLTLISREAIAEFVASGHDFAPGESRRQIETSGIDLNALVGRHFRVGEVEAEGVKLCRPCPKLEDMTGKPVLEGLENKGGLRADILTSGVIRKGDEVVALD
jgi:MOSC domain-containing protein YiiM